MGGDGGGDGGFAARQQAEESRKSALRERINAFYGIGSGRYKAPDKSKFITGYTEGVDIPATPPTADEGGYSSGTAGSTGRNPIYDEDAYSAEVEKAKAVGDPTVNAAMSQLGTEEQSLADSTRAFYTEDLKHNYDRAERRNRFALADRGLLGGSAQVDTEDDLKRDNTLGATRLEDEVRGAVASLKNQREAERLNAMQLVNSGAGEDAVAGAQAGLARAAENAAATRKASIASDLFSTGADSVAAGQNAATGALGYQHYMASLRKFTNPVSTKGGTVTPTNP